MEFSSTIRVADLNDYIAPSQDCVVALNGKLKADQVCNLAAYKLLPSGCYLVAPLEQPPG